MFGFNWVDACVVILMILAAFGSLKIGFLNLVFVIAGFFGTLFLAGAIYPHLLPIHDRTLLTIVNANLVLISAIYVAARGFDLSQHIHWSVRRSHPSSRWRIVEAIAAILPGLVASLILIWLLGVMLGRLPFAGLSNSVSDARIVQTLTRRLPPVPAVLAEFNRQVDPNAQPYIFTQPKPNQDFSYDSAAVAAASTKAVESVVRVTSFGCGGVASGSGFVVGPQLVATNAHVIAGVERPIIKYQGRSYEAVSILFNPSLDFAVLSAPGLKAPSLQLVATDVPINTTVAAIGYPGGNYAVAPGLVRNALTVFGRNIYDLGAIARDVYEVQTHVDYGSSGGPIVLADGRVAGIIFSKSDGLPNDAYALASSHLVPDLQRAANAHERVNTGACMAD